MLFGNRCCLKVAHGNTECTWRSAGAWRHLAALAALPAHLWQLQTAVSLSTTPQSAVGNLCDRDATLDQTAMKIQKILAPEAANVSSYGHVLHPEQAVQLTGCSLLCSALGGRIAPNFTVGASSASPKECQEEQYLRYHKQDHSRTRPGSTQEDHDAV